MLDVSSQIIVAQDLITSKNDSIIFGNGQLVTKEYTTYKPLLPFVDELTLLDSKGDSFKTSYTYVADKSPLESTQLQQLHNQNRLSEMLEVENDINGSLLERKTMAYGVFSGLTLPTEVKNLKGQGTEKVELEYLDYDDKGNLLEFQKPGGAPISYIWGYN